MRCRFMNSQIFLMCWDALIQVAIKCPNRNEHAYVNRKGFHSINVQCICDANMMFLDAVVKYPGSAHDSFIFGQSQIKERLLTGDFGDKWLLGDSGYALRSYLLTPYLSCNSQGERNFNRSHKRTRVQIERSFGILKSRFLCLSHKVSGPLPFVPEKCCKVILACIILHNKARKSNLPDPAIVDIEDNDEQDFMADSDVTGHGSVRARLVQNYFL